DIEYWLLEEAKLARMPKPKSLAGRAALVTGGAGGIGQAVARQLLQEGACVGLADLDAEALDQARAEVRRQFGTDSISGEKVDVTDEAGVQAALDRAIESYGGLDILISNAGIASAAPLEDTDLELWNRNLAVLATGYFLVSRNAYRIMTK